MTLHYLEAQKHVHFKNNGNITETKNFYQNFRSKYRQKLNLGDQIL